MRIKKSLTIPKGQSGHILKDRQYDGQKKKYKMTNNSHSLVTIVLFQG